MPKFNIGDSFRLNKGAMGIIVYITDYEYIYTNLRNNERYSIDINTLDWIAVKLSEVEKLLYAKD